MRTFSIQEDVLSLFPELSVAVVVVRDATNSTENPTLGEMLQREEEATRSVFSSIQLSEHPNIQAWRKAYKLFDPDNHYRSSIEALVRRVVKGDSIPRINAFVDAYNLISLKYLLPVGGEDLDAVRGSIMLRRADGNEEFVPLGKEANEPPVQGEVGHFDDAGCLCRRFNWREADRTKLTAKTRNGFFVLEGLPPVNAIELKEAASSLAQLLTTHCQGDVECFLVNREYPLVTIPI